MKNSVSKRLVLCERVLLKSYQLLTDLQSLQVTIIIQITTININIDLLHSFTIALIIHFTGIQILSFFNAHIIR